MLLKITTYIFVSVFIILLVISGLQIYFIYSESIDNGVELSFCLKSGCIIYFQNLYKEPLSILGLCLKLMPVFAFILAINTYAANLRSSALTNKMNTFKEFDLYVGNIVSEKSIIKESLNIRVLFKGVFRFDSKLNYVMNEKFRSALSDLKSCVVKASSSFGVEKNRFDKEKHISNISDILSNVGITPNTDVSFSNWNVYETEVFSFIDCVIEDWFGENNIKLSELNRDYSVAK